ncbi:sulfatase-like hydrolase/transferase [Nocardia sp. NPDC046763]|uniref:sulfatase-like hydrolase/transferase n=1 Tax=Nocardia sp. NPDC046763 TaxID=3155256 RepID=UPI0033DED70D
MPDQIADRADFEHLINGFDGGIMFWDPHFGRLRAAIAELGPTEDIAIIVSADHSESFGEQGSYAEHGLANEPVHRLPMVVYWPGVTDRTERRRCDALPYNIDYPPTICDLLSLPIPPRDSRSRWSRYRDLPPRNGSADRRRCRGPYRTLCSAGGSPPERTRPFSRSARRRSSCSM